MSVEGSEVGTGSGAPLLRVRDLATELSTPRGPLRAVDGVSFDLAQGETLGVVGESGSGKSMLVRTIMGLLPRNATTEGRIEFDGRDIRGLPPTQARRLWGTEIAMVFQDPMTSLNPVKRVGTHITESLRYHLKLNRADAQARAIELLDQVGIPDPEQRLRQYPHELSGGMRQRVTVAIALACEPRLLVADEPTTALDVTVQKQILDLLGRLQAERQMAMILITHDLGVVAGRADRVAVMYAGRLVETAPTTTLYEAVRHPYTEALLRSVPRLDQPSHHRLDAIGGRPPDLTDPPPGCRFAPRCRYAAEACTQQDQRLRDLGHDHLVACRTPVGTPEAEASRAANEAAVAAGERTEAVVS
jgi:peptide/nickel transport system ATP-binding protein